MRICVRVLVTGANGHLGVHVIRELLHQSHEVVAFVRAGADLRGLQGVEVALARGDMRELASLEAAAGGCAAILHLAAPFQTRASEAELLAPMLAGTRNVMQIAAKLRARVVATSSIAAIGFVSHSSVAVGDVAPRPRSEADWNPDPRMPYFRAKLAAERLAWRLAESLGVELVVLCPGMIAGPLDHRITPTTYYLRHLAAGTGFSGPGGLSLVHVADVARAHVAALTRAAPGMRLAIGGENLTYRRLAALVERETGVHSPHVPLPRALLLPFLWVHEQLDRRLDRTSWETYHEAFETLARYGYLDSSLAARVLDHQPRPASETVRDALRWLVHVGELPPGTCEALRERLPADPAWTRTKP